MPTRRFAATEQTTMRALQSTLRKMGATNLKLTQEFSNGACEIQFDRKNRRYTFRNNAWGHPLDNLRATQLTISHLYQATEAYGTQRTEQPGVRTDPFVAFFSGFEALPEFSLKALPSGNDWWQVLGVERNAPRPDVEQAYRALARLHHPDLGGNVTTMRRINEAWEQAAKDRGWS